MKALAILQAGTANLTVGMWAKPSFLALVRATARFSSVGKVRADCGQSEGKTTKSREKSLTHSIYIPFAPSRHPSPGHAARLLVWKNRREVVATPALPTPQIVAHVYALTCTIPRPCITGDTMRVISYTEARNSFKAVLDGVSDDQDITIINRRDGADAVVMSFDYYQSVMETLHLVSSPANAAKLATAIAQDKAGKAKSRKLLAA